MEEAEYFIMLPPVYSYFYSGIIDAFVDIPTINALLIFGEKKLNLSGVLDSVVLLLFELVGKVLTNKQVEDGVGQTN